MSVAGSQFVSPQGTLTEDRTLATHHIYPSLASSEEGQKEFVHERVFLNIFEMLVFNLMYLFHTHVISDEWMRPVMRKDKHVMVHWGMHPDR